MRPGPGPGSGGSRDRPLPVTGAARRGGSQASRLPREPLGATPLLRGEPPALPLGRPTHLGWERSSVAGWVERGPAVARQGVPVSPVPRTDGGPGSRGSPPLRSAGLSAWPRGGQGWAQLCPGSRDSRVPSPSCAAQLQNHAVPQFPWGSGDQLGRAWHPRRSPAPPGLNGAVAQELAAWGGEQAPSPVAGGVESGATVTGARTHVPRAPAVCPPAPPCPSGWSRFPQQINAPCPRIPPWAKPPALPWGETEAWSRAEPCLDVQCNREEPGRLGPQSPPLLLGQGYSPMVAAVLGLLVLEGARSKQPGPGPGLALTPPPWGIRPPLSGPAPDSRSLSPLGPGCLGVPGLLPGLTAGSSLALWVPVLILALTPHLPPTPM